jgi:anti-sigma regulatory factor (Ser/Thr protein kinase)
VSSIDRAGERFTFSVLCGRSGPAAARAELARRLTGAVDDDALETLALLASETVTNAVKHGSCCATGTVDIDAQLTRERIWLEVTNAGPEFSHAAALPLDSVPEGRGLFLVDALARTWGAVHTDGRTSVWFEVDRRG